MPGDRKVVWLVLLGLLLPGPGAPSDLQAQAPDQDRIQVLFLGDERLHRPFERAKEILPVLAYNGIDMFYTDDPAELNPDRLNDFHALIFYHNHPTITSDQLQALLTFLENGGGLVALHSASAAFQNSEAYIRLIGGAFKSHGGEVFGVERVESEHPAIRSAPSFESWDETYIHTKHNPVNRTVLEVRREGDHEEPWTWVRTYGEGRVFYTAWGHDERTWGTDGFQQLVARGVRWSAGDWAIGRVPDEPVPEIVALEVPLPTYVEDAPWNTLGEPLWEAQAPLSIEDSFALTTLHAGFSLDAFATEPMIGRIIDFTWDERGRMWAVETNDYPHIMLDDGEPGGDRILILEDTNGDGRADEVTVFADGFNLATTLAFIDGGLVVGQAPHIYFLQDTNGDDQADVREIIMTGWPRNDTHGTLSNFRYNFDNQVLGSVGYNGFRGEVAGRVWQPGEFYAGYFRFTPDGSSLDYLARTSNNTWGVALSEDGFIFGSTANDRPSNFVHIPARYYHSLGMREPILPGIEDRPDIYPIRDIRQVDWFGRYSSGSAHELYTARAFPKEYWNRAAFVTDPTGHLIGMFDLTRDATTFQAKNRWNFLASRDGWLAPVQVKVGPDGALWVSDFYTLVAQHNPYVEMEGCCPRGAGNAYETPNRDADHARIYRISYDDAPDAEPMRLDNAATADLVQALDHDNMFWRFTAQRLLVERNATDAVPALVEYLDDHTIDGLGMNPAALHALWTLDGLGAYTPGSDAMRSLRNALHHPASSLRRAALMVLPRDTQLETDVFDAGLLPDRGAPGSMNLATGSATLQDADPGVRMEAVLALSELPASDRIGMAVRDLLVVPVNARDRWMPDAVAVAAAQHAPGLALELMQEEPRFTDDEYMTGMRTVVQFLTRFHALNQDLDALVALLEAVPDAHDELAMGVLVGIAGHPIGEEATRIEWRVDAGGWPEDVEADLTAEHRERVRDAANRAPLELQERFDRVAQRWGLPDLFE